MIPLAGSIFWGPMAITIMGGLFVATVLTLVVVPALYALWFRVRADEDAAASAPTVASNEPPGIDMQAWAKWAGPKPTERTLKATRTEAKEIA
jgi:hypothetical protein